MSDNFAAARHRMLETDLRGRGIRDPRVLAAIASVPREHFVPAQLRVEAYDDTALPIGFEQTISQPFTVAFMAEALELDGSEKVLEIGTGSGYGAAILSRLVHEVHTIERIPQLGEQAKRRLAELHFDNVHVHIDDGAAGLRNEAPFDAICVTAAAEHLPTALIDQLAPHGRLVIPIGPANHSQRLIRCRRNQNGIQREDLGGFVFVPLVSPQNA